jgi:hypothetical protein
MPFGAWIAAPLNLPATILMDLTTPLPDGERALRRELAAKSASRTAERVRG